MALDFRLEFLYDESDSADAGVYIHMRQDPPVYQDHVTKEDFAISEEPEDFVSALFEIEGVVEVSVKAYRVWIMKSPVFTWLEVLTPTMNTLKTLLGESTLNMLPASGKLDGSGFTLSAVENRRSV